MSGFEEMLDEHGRSAYRSFRDMGLSERGAYEAVLGRDRRYRGPVHSTGLAVDSLAESFERLGMSEESARHAAGGRRSTFEETRAAEVAEVRRRVEEAKAPPRPAPRSKPKAKPATTTRRERISETWADRVAADIADIEAGRRPSDRYRKD